MKPVIEPLNFTNPKDQDAFKELMQEYSSHPMGGATPLNRDIIERAIQELQKLPHAHSFLAKTEGGQPVGLMNCFAGFSTFKAKPLLNIHDFVVHHSYRGQGIAGHMLSYLESYCRRHNFCKLTLEVLEKNDAAQTAYKKFGFEGYQLDSNTGHALFWQKEIQYD